MRIEQGQLSESTSRRGAEHPVAWPKPRALVGGYHLAGEFAARGERHRNLDLVLAGDQQHIGEVHGRGMYPHHQLARTGDRIGDVIDNEVFRGPIGAADNGAHQLTPNPRKQNRTKWSTSSGPGCCAESR